MSEPANSYDEVPYESTPFWFAHPDRLATIGRLSGIDAAEPGACRVLELGCGLGSNLLPMALTLPGSEFVGVDLSAAQVAQANADATALGLTNLDVRQADIRDVDASWGSFDYVICHGVYSWVPAAVKEHILAVCGERLTASGLALVSYNVYPGWGLRRMIRDLMRFHTEDLPTAEVKIQQARAVLDFMAKATGKDPESPYGKLLAREVGLVRRCSDSYLFHEHLEDVNEPIYYHQLVERAGAAGLKCVAEAAFNDLARFLYAGRSDPPLERTSREFVRLEQYRDFVRNRTFRATVLCREDVTLAGAPEPQALDRLWVASPGPEGDDPATPLCLAALRSLGQVWPQALPGADLYALATGVDAEDDEDARRALQEEVLLRYANTKLELRPRKLPFVTEVAERPVACPLVRLQAKRDEGAVSSRRHDAVGVSTYQRRILELLDGTRAVEDMIPLLVEAAQRGDIEVLQGPDELPLTDGPKLREVFEHTLPEQLVTFASRALLV